MLKNVFVRASLLSSANINRRSPFVELIPSVRSNHLTVTTPFHHFPSPRVCIYQYEQTFFSWYLFNDVSQFLPLFLFQVRKLPTSLVPQGLLDCCWAPKSTSLSFSFVESCVLSRASSSSWLASTLRLGDAVQRLKNCNPWS